MHRVRLRWIFFYFVIPLCIHAQEASTTPERTERPGTTPLTVCELLEDLDQYAGKVVAVVGRLSSNLFDGAWLSENDCSGKVPRSDPHWPYAVFLGCFDETRPTPGVGAPDINVAGVQGKLDRLRKTTPLDYYTPLVAPSPGEGRQKPQPKKETWAVAFGRIKAAPAGKAGWFGAVRAQASLCSSPESKLVHIEEPDPLDTAK